MAKLKPLSLSIFVFGYILISRSLCRMDVQELGQCVVFILRILHGAVMILFYL
jgi:hypothetical protein